MTTTFLVQIDFDNDGSFATSGDDISAYVIEVPSVEVGMATARDRVAAGGRATIVVNNEDKRFSPQYASGAYYNKLLPGRPVRIQATDGVDTWTLFRGVVRDILPAPGDLGGKRAVISCHDRIAQMQRTYVSLPAQRDKSGDYLLRLIGSEAFKTARATGTILFGGNPANNDTVTVNDVTYTFKTSLTPTANEILIGDNQTETAENLKLALNSEDGAGTNYAVGTTRCKVARAEVDGEEIEIKATQNPPGFAIGRFSNGNQYWAAQVLEVVTGGSLEKFTVFFGINTGSPTGTITWELRDYDSVNEEPGSTLYETGTFTPDGTVPEFTEVAAAGSTEIVPGTYCFVLKPTSNQTTDNHWNVLATDGSNDVYSDGVLLQLQADPLGTWGTWPGQDMIMTMSIYTRNLTLTAIARGAWANSVTLAESSTVLGVSGAVFSGGVDGPESAIDYETGKRTFGVAADTWDAENTTAMRAIMDVVESERGLFWADRDGDLVFKNTSYEFGLFDAAAALSLSSTHAGMDAGMRLQDIYNRVSVRYTPRALLDAGPVAQSTSDIDVPPGKGGWRRARTNPSDDLQGEATTVHLRYVDPSTGQPMGAEDLVLPLEANVDYTVRNPEGQDITDYNFVTASVAETAAGVDVTLVSIRKRHLTVTDLQVRGVGIVSYDPRTVTLDDADSQAAYGRQMATITLPLEANDAQNFAESLAAHSLGQWKNPVWRAETLAFGSDLVVGGTNVLSVELGDIVDVTEGQTDTSGQRALVVGALYSLRDSEARAMLRVRRIDTKTYWRLDDSTYSVLGSTTRLAI